MQMRDEDLCALIDREAQNAIGSDDYTSFQRARAMSYYMGEAEGELAPPEVQGRSKVVSKDLMDTVEWAMPALMRMFTATDDIVRFEPEGPEDEQACDDATNYCGYLLFRKNEGFTVLHDAIKSCLITRMGVVKVYCDKRWEEKTERYEGISAFEVEALSVDPEIEISQIIAMGEVPQEVLPPDAPLDVSQTYYVEAKRKREVMEFRVEGCPPEEILINKDCRSITDVRFICHRREMTISDLLSLGYPKDEVEALPSDQSPNATWEQQERHDYDGSWTFDNTDPGDPSQRKVTVTEAYLRVDVNGDGISEYRRVVKAGTTVFENEETDDHPFSLFCPILMPYKIIGLSYHDLTEDLQRVKTVLTRQVLDNVYLSNNQRNVVLEGQVNLDDLLNPRPGGIVRAKNLDAVRPLEVPFVAAAGAELINQIDAIRDTRTGVTEMNSALNGEALAKGNVGSEGIAAMMQAGVQRLELVARVLAETGIKRIYQLLLKNVSQYANRTQQVRINGRWLQMDPREWKNRYDMTISVGIGNMGKAQRAAALMQIGAAQEKLVPTGMVTPQNLYNTASRLAQELGYPDSDQFFTAPQPDAALGGGDDQGEGDPGQALIAAEQVKAQASLQKAQMDNATKLQVEREKIESQERVAMFKAQQEVALQRERQQAEVTRAVYSQPNPQEAA
ncbi:portal protein [Stenotrophomonas maltophilia]|uniref:portal protein n=1 Tax=Stenotrophomonas maltophilia TaxID=40324 RepID=UPI0007F88212|nr:hypothetical protein [Stenotrophomonas maltophilia]OBU59184.1 hypothetical protein A9K70_01280 [Stenotrophomonas maltophilia]